MWVEALEPITIKTKDGSQDVDPGTPIKLSDEQARRLLESLEGKVHAVPSPHSRDWVDPNDPRFKRLWAPFVTWLDTIRPSFGERHPLYRAAIQELDRMDASWINGDLEGFKYAIQQIMHIGEPRHALKVG
tara:strand:+ start:1026 stop:1418 length:393 start_codon:yes stop_codon:yes gene_type:complete